MSSFFRRVHHNCNHSLLQHRQRQHASASKDIKAAPKSEVTRNATFLYEDDKTCTPDQTVSCHCLRQIFTTTAEDEEKAINRAIVLRLKRVSDKDPALYLGKNDFRGQKGYHQAHVDAL